MTTSTSLNGRSLQPKAPLKGSFPLDHLGECKPLAKLYSTCLLDNEGAAGQCREIARRYLECRMEAGLMAREEMSSLGLAGEVPAPAGEGVGGDGGDVPAERRPEERQGFVAGMRTAKRRRNYAEKTEGDT